MRVFGQLDDERLDLCLPPYHCCCLHLLAPQTLNDHHPSIYYLTTSFIYLLSKTKSDTCPNYTKQQYQRVEMCLSSLSRFQTGISLVRYSSQFLSSPPEKVKKSEISIFSRMISWKVTSSLSSSKKGCTSTSTALMRSSALTLSIFSRRSASRGQPAPCRCSPRDTPLMLGRRRISCSPSFNLRSSFEPTTLQMLSRQSMVLDPRKSSFLVSSSPITQPNAQMSTADAQFVPPRSSQGARQDLPFRQARLLSPLRMLLADPKSPRATRPLLRMRKLSGRMSRWVIALEWRQKTALAIWQQMALKIRYYRRYSPRMKSLRLQSYSYIRMFRCPYDLYTSTVLTTKLLLIFGQISSSLLSYRSCRGIFLSARCFPVAFSLTLYTLENCPSLIDWRSSTWQILLSSMKFSISCLRCCPEVASSRSSSEMRLRFWMLARTRLRGWECVCRPGFVLLGTKGRTRMGLEDIDRIELWKEEGKYWEMQGIYIFIRMGKRGMGMGRFVCCFRWRFDEALLWMVMKRRKEKSIQVAFPSMPRTAPP